MPTAAEVRLDPPARRLQRRHHRPLHGDARQHRRRPARQNLGPEPSADCITESARPSRLRRPRPASRTPRRWFRSARLRRVCVSVAISGRRISATIGASIRSPAIDADPAPDRPRPERFFMNDVPCHDANILDHIEPRCEHSIHSDFFRERSRTPVASQHRLPHRSAVSERVPIRPPGEHRPAGC